MSTTPDNGAVTVTRPGPGQVSRTIRYRYGGRSLLVVLGALGFIVLMSLGMFLYAAIDAMIAALILGGMYTRVQADLRWLLNQPGGRDA